MGTSHQGDKGEIQVTEMASMRVPIPDTGAELPVVVKKFLSWKWSEGAALDGLVF